MNRMDGKTAVVTGGGGPNIGRSIATLLASEGATVIVLDSDDNKGKETLKTISTDGGTAEFIPCDLTDVDEVESAAEETVSRQGTVDVLVNNVGRSTGCTLDTLTEEDFEKNIDVNLKSAVFSTKAYLPHMDEGSSVVFVSSINALLGGFSEVGYSAAKAGLHSLAKVLTADYGSDGIRFNVVCAGSIIGDSETWRSREEEAPGTLEAVADAYPLGRYGDPEDVAQAVLFLASEESSWISGVVLPVDGGMTATGRLPGGKWWEKLRDEKRALELFTELHR